MAISILEILAKAKLGQNKIKLEINYGKRS
jgi:hypothetical protein